MRKDNREKTVVMPENFMFDGLNINRCILFINELMDDTVRTILIDFSKVKMMELSDYMVLMAQIEKAKKENKTLFKRTGAYPRSSKLKNILKGGQTVKHRDVSIPDLKDAATERKLIPAVVNGAAKELSRIGINEPFSHFQTFLTEIMDNAAEHGIQEKKLNWWLINVANNKTKTMRFVFVDMGVGIIGSHKDAGLPFKYSLYRSITKVPLDSLYGKLGSSTKRSNRGRGLKQIRTFIETGIVSDFVLITNCVSLRYENGKFITTRNKEFTGTYFSWTISKETFITWKNTQ